MLEKKQWLLPEGIEEILPDDALHLEALRRKLLDVFSLWGYELVIPPMIDYLESLLIGSGRDLDLQTFKLTDQLSGEVLGIRADITPLVARIDAHNLQHEHPNRLCYTGTILHTRGDSLKKTRSPMQIGAELYGHSGIESDIEIIELMLEMLAMAGIENVHLDLGNVAIYRGLIEQSALTELQEVELFDVLQRKSQPDLQELIARYPLDESLKAVFLKLPELNGGFEILAMAQQLLKDANDRVKNALADLEHLAKKLQISFPALSLSFDLAELRGYHYHTGMVFAAFVPEIGKEIARGGRYDNIGEVFGRARAATGFSADLKVLSLLTKTIAKAQPEKILAPCVDDSQLAEFIRDLRAQQKIVIQQLPEQSGNIEEMGCQSIIEKTIQGWAVSKL